MGILVQKILFLIMCHTYHENDITKFDHRKIYFLNHPMPIFENCSISLKTFFSRKKKSQLIVTNFCIRCPTVQQAFHASFLIMRAVTFSKLGLSLVAALA